MLGLDDVSTEHGDLRTPAGDAVVRFRNWPDVPSDARNSLNAHLALMESLGVPVTDDLLNAYSQAVDAIAAVNISATTAPEDVNQLIMTAAVGMHLHGQLVLKLLALAHASHAIDATTRTLKRRCSPTAGEGASRKTCRT